MKCHKQWLKFFQIGLSLECTRWHKNQQAYLEVIWKENKTDDVICLHFGVYGNICGHMIPSSEVGHPFRELTKFDDLSLLNLWSTTLWMVQRIPKRYLKMIRDNLHG